MIAHQQVKLVLNGCFILNEKFCHGRFHEYFLSYTEVILNLL